VPRRYDPAARRTRALSGITGIATTLVVGAILTAAGVALPTETATASTAQTFTAAQQDPDVATAPFPDLAVTVSQTDNLVAQGLTVSWTGGKKSTPANSQSGGENFLQVMQCWGDEPLQAGADPATPRQPDRTTCQYGAFLSPGATRDSFREKASDVASQDLKYTAPGDGFAKPTYTSVPFLSATGGELIASVVDNKKVPVDVNTNKHFSAQNSNEIAWAGSGTDGSGSAKFEVQTAQQAPGLGCGTPVTAADGTITGTPCWLVVIPRGTADGGTSNISQSGLFYDSWKHKLAVKLDFRPLGIHCAIGAAERQLAGSELVAGAVASWQPQLCNAEGGSIYTILTGSENDSRTAANGTAPAPMALTSRPLGAEGDALAYAPVALTGLSIAFSIDREPKEVASTPAAFAAKARLPFESLNLTPRLVAKLLTNSYLDSLPYAADRSHLGYVSAAEPGRNPRNLTFDPDFIAVNGGPTGEWAYQAITAPSLADLLVPQGRSDAATVLWTYVNSDPAAVAFLAGEPDQWGMVVNPWNSTDAKSNKSGVAFQIPRDDFPKADSVEQPAADGVDPINLVTWRPYTNDLDSSGYLTLRGDGQILGGWDPISVPKKYTKTARSVPGIQRVIGLTDAASAEKYQIVSAALLNPAGSFVAPTSESLSAAAAAMTASPAQPQVYGFDPASTPARGALNAYPLAMPVYAAVNPAMDDPDLRLSYATFIRYAAGKGQTPGAEVGNLPAGYAPIPEGWKTQALAAATVIASTAPRPAEQPTAQTVAVGAGTLDPAAEPSAPAASGDAVIALAGPATPDDPTASALQAAVPGSLLAGFASALLVPLTTRIRRKLI